MRSTTLNFTIMVSGPFSNKPWQYKITWLHTGNNSTKSYYSYQHSPTELELMILSTSFSYLHPVFYLSPKMKSVTHQILPHLCPIEPASVLLILILSSLQSLLCTETFLFVLDYRITVLLHYPSSSSDKSFHLLPRHISALQFSRLGWFPRPLKWLYAYFRIFYIAFQLYRHCFLRHELVYFTFFEPGKPESLEWFNHAPGHVVRLECWIFRHWRCSPTPSSQHILWKLGTSIQQLCIVSGHFVSCTMDCMLISATIR